jgi:hypothetical protein
VVKEDIRMDEAILKGGLEFAHTKDLTPAMEEIFWATRKLTRSLEGADQVIDELWEFLKLERGGGPAKDLMIKLRGSVEEAKSEASAINDGWTSMALLGLSVPSEPNR